MSLELRTEAEKKAYCEGIRVAYAIIEGRVKDTTIFNLRSQLDQGLLVLKLAVETMESPK